jgi:peptide/nickel transport system permease protein
MPEPTRSRPLQAAGRATDVFQGSAVEGTLAAVTEAPASDALIDDEPTTAGKRRRRPRKKFGFGFWAASTWLIVLVLLAITADWLPFVGDPDVPHGDAFRAPPSSAHWFGGDTIGRDIFSRIVYGGRVSLTIGVATIALGMLIGGSFGLIAGYFRGRSETVITSVADVMLAFPPLILALALVAFLGRNLQNIILALVILSIPSLVRITRAATLSFSQREFVLASRTLGASHKRILLKEILPNVIPPMASFALLAIAIVIVAEGALSFLGLSVESPTPTWGNMINEGRSVLDDAPHIALIPCAVMFLTLVSINYVGDRLRSLFNVKESGL